MLVQLAAAAHALVCGDHHVIHLHGAENGFVAPLLRLRYPVVTTNHGPAYLREKWSGPAKKLIRAAEGAERLLAGLGLVRGEYLLFAAAHVDPTKGCHTLIETLGRLREPPPLLVVGDLHHAPGYEERLRGLARNLPVSFVPRLDAKPVVLGLLRGARLFVFPSEVEAMSMMLLEALCQSAPTLASDIPENTSILPRGFPVFRAADAAALAAALTTRLAAAPETRRRDAAAAREWVSARYS